MENNLMVSIDCITYNHEDYIAEAIESFLCQKTDFEFEILIHDDASTDKTAEIIKRYETKYPKLIKPIYQTENQYSKGATLGLFNEERAKGKYIAVCEGDDYWTDPYKLQKQVDFMEAHPECSMCVHAANRVSAISKKIVSSVRPAKESRVLSVEEIIEGGGGFIATNSILYVKDKISDYPAFYLNSPIGDYPLVIHGALQGSVYYMEDNMSAYRIGVMGSWTQKEFSQIDKKIKHMKEMSEMLDGVNRFTGFTYNDVIQRTKKKEEFYLLLESGQIKQAKTEEYREFYNQLEFKRKMAFQVKTHFPTLSQKLIYVKSRLLQQ